MEWCLDCHRNPAKYLRPTGEVYNMAWEKPSGERPVACAASDEKSGVLTAESVRCVTKESMQGANQFTSQDQLGSFLVAHYKIRTPNELSSCEVCHR
jgi:hypothetical protein